MILNDSTTESLFLWRVFLGGRGGEVAVTWLPCRAWPVCLGSIVTSILIAEVRFITSPIAEWFAETGPSPCSRGAYLMQVFS